MDKSEHFHINFWAYFLIKNTFWFNQMLRKLAEILDKVRIDFLNIQWGLHPKNARKNISLEMLFLSNHFKVNGTFQKIIFFNWKHDRKNQSAFFNSNPWNFTKYLFIFQLSKLFAIAKIIFQNKNERCFIFAIDTFSWDQLLPCLGL